MQKLVMDIPEIDRQSAIPIYYQLKESIYQKIKEGEWKRGQKIPSLRELSRELKISLMTARQAIKTLVDERVLTLRKGEGTFILGPKVRENVKTLFSFTAEMLRQNHEPGAQIISKDIINPSTEIAKILQISKKEPVYHICRLRTADLEPVSVQHSYIPVEFCDKLLEKNLTVSLSTILEEDYDIWFEYASQTLIADEADQFISKHLNIPLKAPTMRINRTSFLEDHRPCEYLLSIYRGDRYEFVVELQH
jgi:GntR family transcriptional regulator